MMTRFVVPAYGSENVLLTSIRIINGMKTLTLSLSGSALMTVHLLGAIASLNLLSASSASLLTGVAVNYHSVISASPTQIVLPQS